MLEMCTFFRYCAIISGGNTYQTGIRMSLHNMNPQIRAQLAYPLYQHICPNTGLTSTPQELDSEGSPFGKTLPEMERLSTPNRRNINAEYVECRAVWADKFGGKYMSRTYKGIPTTDQKPYISMDPSGDGELRFWYLFTSDCAEHSYRVSQDLRSLGFETERIVEIDTLTGLEYAGQLLSIPDFKRRLVTDADPGIPFSRVELDHLVQGTQFVYVVRDLPTNIRVEDVFQVLCNSVNCYAVRRRDGLYDYMDGTYARNDLLAVLADGTAIERTLRDQLAEHPESDTLYVHNDKTPRLLENIFAYVNTCTSSSHRFDPKNTEDLVTYLAEWLPTRMGKFLGELHQLQLLHKYPHPGNYLASGHLVDLESVTGPAFGGFFPRYEDYLREIKHLFSIINRIFHPHGWVLRDRLGGDHHIRSYLDVLPGDLQIAPLQKRAIECAVTGYQSARDVFISVSHDDQYMEHRASGYTPTSAK